MKIRELIEELNKFDMDKDVYVAVIKKIKGSKGVRSLIELTEIDLVTSNKDGHSQLNISIRRI